MHSTHCYSMYDLIFKTKIIGSWKIFKSPETLINITFYLGFYFTGYNTVFLSLASMYFYQILTAFNKLKIMSDVAHDNWNQLKLYLYIQDQYRNKIDNIRTLSTWRHNLKYHWEPENEKQFLLLSTNESVKSM
jgi:hypothetical protein